MSDPYGYRMDAVTTARYRGASNKNNKRMWKKRKAHSRLASSPGKVQTTIVSSSPTTTTSMTPSPQPYNNHLHYQAQEWRVMGETGVMRPIRRRQGGCATAVGPSTIIMRRRPSQFTNDCEVDEDEEKEEGGSWPVFDEYQEDYEDSDDGVEGYGIPNISPYRNMIGGSRLKSPHHQRQADYDYVEVVEEEGGEVLVTGEVRGVKSATSPTPLTTISSKNNYQESREGLLRKRKAHSRLSSTPGKVLATVELMSDEGEGEKGEEAAKKAKLGDGSSATGDRQTGSGATSTDAFEDGIRLRDLARAIDEDSGEEGENEGVGNGAAVSLEPRPPSPIPSHTSSTSSSLILRSAEEDNDTAEKNALANDDDAPIVVVTALGRKKKSKKKRKANAAAGVVEAPVVVLLSDDEEKKEEGNFGQGKRREKKEAKQQVLPSPFARRSWYGESSLAENNFIMPSLSTPRGDDMIVEVETIASGSTDKAAATLLQVPLTTTELSPAPSVTSVSPTYASRPISIRERAMQSERAASKEVEEETSQLPSLPKPPTPPQLLENSVFSTPNSQTPSQKKGREASPGASGNSAALGWISNDYLSDLRGFPTKSKGTPTAKRNRFPAANLSSLPGDSGSFDWRGQWGVQPAVHSFIYDEIARRRGQWPKEFAEFDQSIWQHMMHSLQNDKTYLWKMGVRTTLEHLIKQTYPSSQLVAVGSTVNGCGHFDSDMDLCLCVFKEGEEGLRPERGFATRNLRKIGRDLYKLSNLVDHVEFINAKVPILRISLQAPYQRLVCDMNVNNVAGIYNSHLLHYYARVDDRFPALCLLVKQWAKRMGICDASNGTFNSYSLNLLVLHFLQVGASPPLLPNLQRLYPSFFCFGQRLDKMRLFRDLPRPLPEAPKNGRTVSELVIAFFDYYTNFDFEDWAISVAEGGIKSRYDLARNADHFPIFIEEPYEGLNTARCIRHGKEWERIQACFVSARDALHRSRKTAPHLGMLRILKSDYVNKP